MGVTFLKRLKISVHGNHKLNFYSKSGMLLASGYSRVVIGKRGPYIEFAESHILKENFHIPQAEEYRETNNVCYYIEHRSNDESYVKLYHQKRRVAYADYKIGMYYISPFDLFMRDSLPTIV